MKLRLSFFVMSLLIMASCATDQPIGPEPDPGESDFTILEHAGEAILKALDENEGDRQALISAIRAIPEVETLTEVQDNIDGEPIDQLDLTLTDGTPYIVNLVEKETEPEMTQAESDRLDSLLDSIQNVFDSKIPHISANTQSAPGPGSGLSPLSAPTRATPGNNRPLTKKKAILLSLDTDLRKEDIKYINKIKNDKDKVAVQIVWDIPAIEKITPDFFTTLANYDIVVVGCHGLVSGEIFFPSDCMSASLRQKYNKLVVKNKKGQPQSYQKSGVHPGTMTYRSGKKRPGFYLDNIFFDEYLPSEGALSHTIFWSVHCFSSFKNNKSVKGLDYVCNVRDAADYFGSGTLCLGSEVYPLFMQWYKQLVNGVASDVAWKNSLPHCKYQPFQKVFSSGRNYYSSTLSKAKYLVPQATGVRRTRTRASDKAAPVVVGARFRYSGDKTGKPEYTGNGGILLREVATGYTSTVPITSDMIQSQRPVEVLDGFVVNEIDVRIDGLKPETDYVYATYIDSDGAMTVSDESFAFRTEKASGQVYYISTEDEFISIMSKPHDGMAFLMNDITIKKWDKNAEGGSNFRGLYTNLDGQGHKLYFVGGDYAPVSFTISKSFGTDGRQCSNVIFQLDDGGYIEASSPWKIVNCTFRDVNHLSLSAYMYGSILINSPVSISNRGILRDCKFSFENYKGFSDYAIENSGLVERCQFTPGGDVINFVYNDDNGTVRDCHLDTRSPAMFGSNGGLISNCSLTCIVSEPDTSLNKMSGAISFNRGTVEDFVSDLQFSFETASGFWEKYKNLWVMRTGAPLCGDNEGRLVRCINRSNVINYSYPFSWRSAAICPNNSGEVTDCGNYGEISVKLNNINICHEDDDRIFKSFVCACVINVWKSAKVSGLVNHGSYGPRPVCPVCGKQCGTYTRQDVVEIYYYDFDTSAGRKVGSRINRTRINKSVNKGMPHRGPLNKKRPSPRGRVR